MNPHVDGQHPSWRLWGEERLDDAIYMVYLKKVRYHPAAPSIVQNSDDLVSHLEWETVKVKIIKAGTLERLVESLATESGELDSTYVNIFLSTYRSFTSAQKVLTLIFDRFRILGTKKAKEMPDQVRELHKRTYIQILMVWLDMHPEDFNQPPQYLLLHQLLEFAAKYAANSPLELRVIQRLDKIKRDETDHCFKEMPWYNLEISSPPSIVCYDFMDVPDDYFARQLTWLDAELFKKLIPHHCLGSVWSRRDEDKSPSLNTVNATVQQFNSVSLRVISSVLTLPTLQPPARARIITKWINIAQELRFLKNFSSLKAISAALQSNSVYRIRKVWFNVPREKVEMFTELARIFSEENNQSYCRELLLKEGTAKFVTVGENDKQLHKVLQKQLANKENKSVMEGTIPYLGTFLTDLTMIDTAIPDYTPEDLINFDKRRKEFEVLAQLKLLQSAANNYNVIPDVGFHAWFGSLPILDENENYQLSCLIEPPVHTDRKPPQVQRIFSNGHKKCDSTSSNSTNSSSSQFYDYCAGDATHHINVPKLSDSSSVSTEQPEFYIVRVSVECGRKATEGVNLYKSIMLSNRDHTREVKCNAMMKHGLIGDPDDYSLSQILTDREMVFPSNANVYYAINTAYDLNLVLRPLPPDAQVKKNKIEIRKVQSSTS